MIFALVEDITVQQCLVIAVTALATALGFLFKIVDKYRRDCENDRRQLWNKLVDMTRSTCGDQECGDRQPLSLRVTDINLSGRGRDNLKTGTGDVA